MRKLLVRLTLAMSALIFIAACSKAKDTAVVAPTTSVYQGGGSKWSISISSSDTGDFTISKFNSAGDTTAAMVVSGTYQRFPNRFVKLTVASSTGSGGPAAGELAYGLEIPGYAFFLKPLSGSAEPIVMIQGGTCPSTNFNANWIIAKPKPSVTIDTSQDMFGSATMTFNGASSSLVVSQNETVNGNYLTTGGSNNNGTSTMAFDLANCSNGVLRIADQGDFFDMYFTSSESVLVKFPAAMGNQIIFGTPKTAAAVTQADLVAEYSGLVFQEAGTTDSLFPVKLSIPASGNSTGTKLASVDNDTLDTDGIVFSNITNLTGSGAALPNGFFRADLNPATSTTNGKASCAFSTVNSVKIIACTGYTENSNKKPFFLLARSR